MKNKQLPIPLMENHDRAPTEFQLCDHPSESGSQVGSKIL